MKSDPENNKKSRTNGLSASQALLDDTALIDFSSPVKKMQYGQARAFDAMAIGEQKPLIAYTAVAKNLPRILSVSRYKYFNHKSLMYLYAAGPVIDPTSGTEHFAFVYEKKEAEPILPDWKSVPEALPYDMIISKIIRPVLEALKLFADNQLAHGAINLRNIYLTGAEDDREALLGECLSSAISKENPALYEPIERAMASPTARNAGNIQCDLYSFGVCVAMLAWRVNPMKGMSDAEIIQKKIEKGSYGLFVGNDKIPSAMTEFLRGVLNDDENQRWTYADVEKWLEGRRFSPKQPAAQLKAGRPFQLKGKKYFYLRGAVKAITDIDGEKAYAIFTGTDFLNWFMRNFDDKNVMANVETILERAKTLPKTGPYKERFVSEFSMALDPTGPVRYKKHAVNVRSFGFAIAEALARQADIQDYAQMLNFQLPGVWLSLQFTMPADASQAANDFERARQYLNQKIPGSGIERVTYMLCPDAPCLSPMFSKDFVHSSAQLLRVLDRKAKGGNLAEPVFDRHIIAFLSVNDSRMIEPHIGLLTSNSKSSQLMGMLKTLAAIQKAENTGPMPHICDYIIQHAQPVIEEMKNVKLRETTKIQIENIKGKGDLVALLRILADERKMAEDIHGFLSAKKEYEQLEARKQAISGTSVRKWEIGVRKGRQVAMLLSAILSSIAILLHIVNYFTG